MPKRRERMGLYTRESDPRLASSTTIESAAKIAREHGERQGCIYDPECDWREAISSVEIPYMNRPQLQAMLDAARRKQFDVLVVSEIRAISRRQVEVLVIYDQLQNTVFGSKPLRRSSAKMLCQKRSSHFGQCLLRLKWNRQKCGWNEGSVTV